MLRASEVADGMWFSSLIPVPDIDTAQNILWDEFGILTTFLSLHHAEIFLQVIPTKIFPAFFKLYFLNFICFAVKYQGNIFNKDPFSFLRIFFFQA